MARYCIYFFIELYRDVYLFYVFEYICIFMLIWIDIDLFILILFAIDFVDVFGWIKAFFKMYI